MDRTHLTSLTRALPSINFARIPRIYEEMRRGLDELPTMYDRPSSAAGPTTNQSCNFPSVRPLGACISLVP